MICLILVAVALLELLVEQSDCVLFLVRGTEASIFEPVKQFKYKNAQAWSSTFPSPWIQKCCHGQNADLFKATEPLVQVVQDLVSKLFLGGSIC